MAQSVVLTRMLQAYHDEATAHLNNVAQTSVVKHAKRLLEKGKALVVPCMWGDLESDIHSFGAVIDWEEIPEGSWLTKDVEYLVAYASFADGVPPVAAEVPGLYPEKGWMIVCPPNQEAGDED